MKWHLTWMKKAPVKVLSASTLAVASLLAAPLSYAAMRGQEKVTITVAWWGTPDRNNRTLKVIQMFEKKYPNIVIQPQYTGWNGYWQKLSTQAAGHSLPDVIQMDYAYINQYVSDHLLIPLDPYVKKGALDLKHVDHDYLVGGYVHGHLYGVNLGANAPTIGMDTQLLKKAGVAPLKPGYTYEQLAKVATQVKQKLGNGHYGTEPFDGYQDFVYYLRQKGLTLYNKAGNGLGYSNDKLLADFFSFWQNLVKKGVAAPPTVTQSVSNIQDELVVHGVEPFIDYWSNQVVAVESSMNHPLTLLPLPSMPGGKQAEYLKPSMFFSVTRDSKHVDAAVKWINYFTNDLQANEVLGAERGVPISSVVRNKMYSHLTGAMKQEFQFIQWVARHSRPINPPEPPAGGKVETIFANIQQEVNYLKITPQEAAKEFRQQATQALQQQ